MPFSISVFGSGLQGFEKNVEYGVGFGIKGSRGRRVRQIRFRAEGSGVEVDGLSSSV